MFLGTNKHTLDTKGRFTLAANFRNNLDKKYHDEQLVFFGFDGCIQLFPESEWEKIKKAIESGNPLSSEHRRRKRALFSKIAPAEIDNQGRMLVPPFLREYAKLSRDLLIIGVQDHLEIWDKSSFENLMEEDGNQVEAFADEIAKDIDLNGAIE